MRQCLPLASILITVAALLMMFPGSSLALLVALSGGSAITAINFFRIIRSGQSVDLCKIMNLSVGIGYIITTFVFSLSNAAFDSEIISIKASSQVLIQGESVSAAVSLALFVQAALYAFELIIPPLDTSKWRPAISGVETNVIAAVFGVIILAALATGKLGYMGSDNGEASGASALGSLAAASLPALAILSACKIQIERAGHIRLAWSIAFIMLLAVTVITGRRNLIYTLILIPIALGAIGVEFYGRRLLYFAIASIAGFAFIYCAFWFFVAIRVATYSAAPGAGTVDLIQSAYKIITSSRIQEVQDYLSKSTSGRQLIITYLAGIMGSDLRQMPLFGQELYVSVASAVPSVVMPGKSALPSAMENVVHPLIGIPVFDAPNSIIVSGYDDFFVFGALLYPPLKAALATCLVRSVHLLKIGVGGTIIMTLLLCFNIMNLEGALLSFFSGARNAFIIVLISSIVARLVTYRAHSEQVRRV